MHAGVTALVLAGVLALYGRASEEPASMRMCRAGRIVWCSSPARQLMES